MATKRQKAMNAVAKSYTEKQEDLRYMPTFQMLEGESVRVTAHAELDKRYMPDPATGDKRYRVNKLGTPEVTAEDTDEEQADAAAILAS